jgi:predicted RecA/RadA family phage recombinase
MATNRIYKSASAIPLTCTAPTTPSSGDPVLCGQIPGVALTDEDDAGVTTVQTDGVFDLSVKAENNAGNVAVAAGDILYYDTAATVKVNKDNTNGVRFGYALEAITSGSTDTIQVKIGY